MTNDISAQSATTPPPGAPDLNAIKQRQQQVWSAGDYTAIGATILLMSEHLCEAVDLRSGTRVLDVATGSGNAALAAARRFGQVTGVDYVPSLLARARERAAVEGLPATFEPGDAEALPYPDTSFDTVLSVVGAMFAPDHARTAHELLRVCRPGGKIGMANWTPGGFVGEMLRLVGRYLPPPAGLQPPTRWGDESYVRELFGDAVSSLSIVRRSHVFRYRSPEHFAEFFIAQYGPTERAHATLDPVTQQSFRRDLADLARRFNRSGDETLVAPGDYLEIVAVRR